MGKIKYLTEKLELYVMEYENCAEEARENLPYSINEICMNLIGELSKLALEHR